MCVNFNGHLKITTAVSQLVEKRNSFVVLEISNK